MIRPMHPFHRTELLVGGEGYDQLTASRALVVGLGGVGSYAAEALVRSGVGHVTMVDFDKVCITNLNRQLHATRKTVRKPKVQLMVERAEQINPKAEIVGLETFYEAENSDEILDPGFDLVLDCIDNMKAKLHLLQSTHERGMSTIAAMGAGGRMDPTRIRVTDISLTHTDPFARIVRENLRERGITEGITAVWTDESPNDLDPVAQANFRCICPGKSENQKHTCDARLQVQGSNSWMPPMLGFTMAGVGVNRLLGREIKESAARERRMRPTMKPSRKRKAELLEAAGFKRGEA